MSEPTLSFFLRLLTRGVQKQHKQDSGVSNNTQGTKLEGQHKKNSNKE